MPPLTGQEIQKNHEIARRGDELKNFADGPVWKMAKERATTKIANRQKAYEGDFPVASIDQMIQDQETLWMLRGMNQAIREIQFVFAEIIDEGERAKIKLGEKRL